MHNNDLKKKKQKFSNKEENKRTREKAPLVNLP